MRAATLPTKVAAECPNPTWTARAVNKIVAPNVVLNRSERADRRPQQNFAEVLLTIVYIDSA
jgi:hypothetical protein